MADSNWLSYLDGAMPTGTPRWVGRLIAVGFALSAAGLAFMALTAAVWVIFETVL